MRHLSLSQDVTRGGTGDINDDGSYQQVGKRPSRRLEVGLLCVDLTIFTSLCHLTLYDVCDILFHVVFVVIHC